MLKSRQTTLLFALVVSIIVGPSVAQADADIPRGEAVFKKCVACHEVERQRSKMGPHLNGLIGRQAGSVAGFKYSQAMRDAGAAGMVWDSETLGKFIASPKNTVPGTSMRFFGLWSDSDIADVIAYINSIPRQEK